MNVFQIFPAIDLRGGQCVRLRQGDYAQETVYGSNPAQTASDWAERGGTFLHLVDLDGAKAGQPVNTEAVRAICSILPVPAEIGGGIRTIQDAESWFECGVSRVIIGTSAIRNPLLADELLKRYGSEKVVLGLDAKDGKVAVSGWTQSDGECVLEVAKRFASKGIKYIIFTDIATDGMMQGPNLAAMQTLCQAVPEVSVIASGGVSSVRDVLALRALGCANLTGAIVGRAIYENPDLLGELLTAAGASV